MFYIFFLLSDLMGDEKDKEMKKLYDAIGYTENEVITPFPKQVSWKYNGFRLELLNVMFFKDYYHIFG